MISRQPWTFRIVRSSGWASSPGSNRFPRRVDQAYRLLVNPGLSGWSLLLAQGSSLGLPAMLVQIQVLKLGKHRGHNLVRKLNFLYQQSMPRKYSIGNSRWVPYMTKRLSTKWQKWTTSKNCRWWWTMLRPLWGSMKYIISKPRGDQYKEKSDHLKFLKNI